MSRGQSVSPSVRRCRQGNYHYRVRARDEDDLRKGGVGEKGSCDFEYIESKTKAVLFVFKYLVVNCTGDGPGR